MVSEGEAVRPLRVQWVLNGGTQRCRHSWKGIGYAEAWP